MDSYKYVKINYHPAMISIAKNQKDVELLFHTYVLHIPKSDDYSLKLLEKLLVYHIFDKLPYWSYRDIIIETGGMSRAYKQLEQHFENNSYLQDRFEDGHSEKILAYYAMNKTILTFTDIDDADHKASMHIRNCINYFTDSIFP